MKQIMVLSDGETFTELDGCEIGTVLYDESEQGSLSSENWDKLIAQYEAEGRVYSTVGEPGAAVIYEVNKWFGPNPQHSGGAA